MLTNCLARRMPLKASRRKANKTSLMPGIKKRTGTMARAVGSLIAQGMMMMRAGRPKRTTNCNRERERKGMKILSGERVDCCKRLSVKGVKARVKHCLGV